MNDPVPISPSMRCHEYQLQKWLRNELDAEECLRVEEHLMHCEHCEQRLDQIDVPIDPIVERLRGASGDHDTVAGADGHRSTLSSSDPRLHFRIAIRALNEKLIDESTYIQACRTWSEQPWTSITSVLKDSGAIDEKAEARLLHIIQMESSATGQSSEEPKSEHRTSFAASDYQLLRLLATGGHGRIWLAKEKSLGRFVALKELHEKSRGVRSVRDRFRQEAMITAQLSHPGTVPLYEFEDDPTQPFYAMKYVDGRTLTELSDDLNQTAVADGGIPMAELFRLLQHFVRVCDTVSYAHAQGILHRDLKGENVVVGDFGEVILLDWGIAKKIDEDGQTDPPLQTDPQVTVGGDVSETKMGGTLGTPGYMAPEQAAGRIDKIDQRTDTYGLASVLYEILTGRPPFRGKDAEKVLSTVMESSPIPPTHYVPSIPTELESICLRGLSKSRQDRFQSAREIGEAIEVWMTSQLEHKRSLQEREKLFQLSVDLLAVVDRGGTIQHINPACESILGWTPDEMIGRTDVDLVHPDHLEDIAKHRANLATDSSPIIGLERKVLCKDGSFRWLSWNVTPVPEQAAVYIVARDITKHKRLAQFICGFRDSDHDAQLLADEDGKILMVNDAACRILNRPRGSLVDREFNDLIASESLQISDESWRLARDDHDSAASARLQFRLPEGEALEEGGGVDVGDQELQASFQAWSTTPQEFLFITLSAIIP